MVITEDGGASLFLRGVMGSMRAPADQCFFVAPARKRQQQSVACQATVTNILDKAVDFFEFGPKCAGMAEIGVPLARPRFDLEQHRKHAPTPGRTDRFDSGPKPNWSAGRTPCGISYSRIVTRPTACEVLFPGPSLQFP